MLTSNKTATLVVTFVTLTTSAHPQDCVCKIDSQHPVVTSLVFSPDHHFLASGGSDSSIRTWEVSSGKLKSLLETGNKHLVRKLIYSADGQWIISSTYFAGAEKTVMSLFPPSTRTEVIAPSGELAIWNVAERKKTPLVTGRQYCGEDLVLSTKDHTLVEMDTDGYLRSWNVESRKEIRDQRVQYYRGTTAYLALSSGGFAWTDGDSIVMSATRQSPIAVKVDTNSPVNAMVLSTDGELLVTGSRDTRLWHSRTLKQIATFKTPGTAVFALAVSPDKKMLAVGSGFWRQGAFYKGSISVYSIAHSNEVMQVEAHNERVTQLAFSANGQLLASGSDDGSICIWRLHPVVGTSTRK